MMGDTDSSICDFHNVSIKWTMKETSSAATKVIADIYMWEKVTWGQSNPIDLKFPIIYSLNIVLIWCHREMSLCWA